MKKRYTLILFLLGIFSPVLLWGQVDTLTLAECIQSSLENSPKLKEKLLQSAAQGKRVQESKSNWWPQIEFAYYYRYNPIVGTSVIPIGQFNPENPSEEIRAIRMGTAWEQSAGLTLTQPLIDFSIKNRLKESKLLQQKAQNEQKTTQNELIAEVTYSFLRICQYESEMNAYTKDTLITHSIWQKQQKLLLGEQIGQKAVNDALINHLESQNQLQQKITELINEKIYLAFLMQKDIDRIVYQSYFLPSLRMDSRNHQPGIAIDSLHQLQQIKLDIALLGKEEGKEKAKLLPYLAFEGFVGGSQFDEDFRPFKGDTWYGRSYLGLRLVVPILQGQRPLVRRKRYQLEKESLQEAYSEQEQKLLTQALQEYNRISQNRDEIKRLHEIQSLLQENVILAQEKFQEQQLDRHEMNEEVLKMLRNRDLISSKEHESISQEVKYLVELGLIYSFYQQILEED